MAYVIQCDRCSKTGGPVEQAGLPSGWTCVGLNIKSAGCTFYKWHQFCPECVEYLDIRTDPVEETSAEKLVAILESMVDEAVNERDA